MNFQNKKLYKLLPYLLFLTFASYLVLSTNINRHWSSVHDQDLIIIFNSLLVRANYFSEYVDHPGYSLIIILSIWLDFLNLIGLNNIADLDDLHKSINPAKDFQTLFIYSRLLNILLIFVFISVLFKIFNCIIDNKTANFIIVTGFTFSLSITEISGHLRTELLSSIFLFSFFYFFLKFLKNNRKFRYYLFLSGICFILSIFSKMQSLLIFIFFPFIFLNFVEKKNILNLSFYVFEIKKIIFYFNILFLLIILLIWNRYSHGFINTLFIPFFLIYVFCVCYHYKKKFFISFKNLNIYLFYFFAGQGLPLLFFYFYSKFNLWNIIVIVNFPGWMSKFHNLYDKNGVVIDITISQWFATTYNDLLNIFIKNINELFIFIDKFFLKIFSFEFFILFLYLVILAFLLLKNKFNKKILFKFSVYFFIFLIISIIFSFRPYVHYLIFLTPIIMIGIIHNLSQFNLLLKKINYIYFSFFFLIISLILSPEKKIYQFHDIDGACNNPTPQYHLKHNLRQMNEDVYYEICNTKI
ncbi:hypothetical protein OAJ75_00115 [Candidatus Pelagibacter sp.]|nr:hypothetical protein [Candidatus Pelagibacter sp.]